MSVLDFLSSLLRKVLQFLPPDAANLLWFPLFTVVLLVSLRFMIRRLLPHLGKVAVQVARVAVTLTGAVLLAVDFAAASGFRLVRMRPHAVIYAYGDAITGALVSAEHLAGKASALFVALAKTSFAIIFLAAGLWVWAWDYRSCPDQADLTCRRPVTQWVQLFK